MDGGGGGGGGGGRVLTQRIQPVILRARADTPVVASKPAAAAAAAAAATTATTNLLGCSTEKAPPRIVTLLPKGDPLPNKTSSSTTKTPSSLIEEQQKEANHVFINDNVKVLVNKKTNRINSNCYICGEISVLGTLGLHLNVAHRVNYVHCPGLKCLPENGKPIKTSLYDVHLREYHLSVDCPHCDGSFDARRYRAHMADSHRILNNNNVNNDNKNNNKEVVDTNKSIAFDTAEATNKTSVIKKRNQKSVQEYALDGELITVDGIHYFIKDYTVFLDCPFCDIACALTVLGAHFVEDHKMTYFSCFANPCDAASNLKSALLHDHFIEEHGSLRCTSCKAPLTLLEVKPHLKYFCPESPEVSAKKRRRNGGDPLSPIDGTKVPTVPCPYCLKQCSYLNKHLRDVHQPKISCDICGKRMGKSYLPEHLKIQHEGKEVPTKKCPLCKTNVQKLKNHFKYMHKLSKEEADDLFDKCCESK